MTLENIQTIWNDITQWMFSLSEKTLSLISIAILHCVFIPNMLAYLNGITAKLPSLDSYVIVVSALVALNLRAILTQDKMAQLIHLIGFVAQLIIVVFVLLK